jgi:hypothetical protein
MTIFITMALARLRAGWLALTLALLALTGAFTTGWTAPWRPRAVSAYQEKIRQESGYEGDAGFMPPDVGAAALHAARALPQVLVAPEGAALQLLRWSPDQKGVQVRNAAPSQVTFHVLNYPGWRATVNGKPTPTANDSLGRVVVAVPAGDNQVKLRFARTPDHLAGIAISVLAAVILGALVLRRGAATSV